MLFQQATNPRLFYHVTNIWAWLTWNWDPLAASILFLNSTPNCRGKFFCRFRICIVKKKCLKLRQIDIRNLGSCWERVHGQSPSPNDKTVFFSFAWTLFGFDASVWLPREIWMRPWRRRRKIGPRSVDSFKMGFQQYTTGSCYRYKGGSRQRYISLGPLCRYTEVARA